MSTNNMLSYGLYKELEKDHFSLMYSGYFSDNITDKLLMINEKNVSSSYALANQKKRISFLLVESFQNILKYGEVENTDIESHGMFLLKMSENVFYITSINLVDNHLIKELKTNIDYINSIDQESLKKEYIKRLSDMTFATQKGAGLGFMEMARKSNNKLHYHFGEYDADKSIFFLTVIINSENGRIESQLNFNMKIYSQFMQNKILLGFKGDFSQDSISPVWKIIKDNLSKVSFSNSQIKKRFLTLVEMTQNIGNHSAIKSQGILLIKKMGDDMMFEAGNYAQQVDYERIKTTFDMCRNSSEKELKLLILSKLTSMAQNKSAGLGLIEIFKHSKELIYNFDHEKNGNIFYQLEAKL